MKSYGDFTEREAKVLKVLGCKKSLKDFVGRKFYVLGAIDSEEKKVAEDGAEYQTNFIKISDENGEIHVLKFTQTVILQQSIDIIENELTDIPMFLEYAESNSGNRYLTITM